MLNRDRLLLAYHDRSDGGLFATICEMVFAAHVGVTVNLDLLAYDEAAHDVDGNGRRPELMYGRVLGAKRHCGGPQVCTARYAHALDPNHPA